MPAWTPPLAVINSRAIAENLLAYFEANQVEAILWANGGTALIPIQRFENSTANRNVPVYPAILFNDDNDATDYTPDLPIGAYSLQFRVLVQNQVAATAVSQSIVYLKAITSMIRNCPNTTYAANTGTHARAAVLETIESGFDVIKMNETQNDFLQEFSIRATYQLLAAGI